MSKDPAVLFYTSDFISGTITMSDEQRGKYILLLCIQHQKGKLTEKDMLNICKTYDIDIWDKFVKDGEVYYNQRMRDETEKRVKYSESRRKNRVSKESEQIDVNNISLSYDEHMENENENINNNKGTWKTDFEIYKNELRSEYEILIENKEYIKQQEKYYPDVDIVLSLEKSCVNFWATEAGWQYKKKARTKDINWKSTLTNAIGMNKVYKKKS